MALRIKIRLPLKDLEVSLRRRVSILLLLASLSSLLLLQGGCSRAEEGEEPEEALTFDISSPVIQERLGTDDGYAFALFYGGDTHGSLETCG
jgi:hypothetical protein